MKLSYGTENGGRGKFAPLALNLRMSPLEGCFTPNVNKIFLIFSAPLANIHSLAFLGATIGSDKFANTPSGDAP